MLTRTLQYITWISNDAAAWTLYAEGLGADSTTNISARSISQEPMVRILPLPVGRATQFCRLVSYYQLGSLDELYNHRLWQSSVPCSPIHRLVISPIPREIFGSWNANSGYGYTRNRTKRILDVRIPFLYESDNCSSAHQLYRWSWGLPNRRLHK